MREPSPGMSVTKGVTLVRHFGSGAMGTVWLADHASLKTKVVVKFMARELVNDLASVERFSREAAAASQVKSPHVVQMLDHGSTPDGQPFIIMEHLEGQDLGTYLTIVGRAPPRIALSIVAQTARALTRAHEVGVVHRDIKPDNLFLTDTGDGEVFVKVLDFGVAKADGLGIGKITTTGNAVGTPCYMSPEQMLGASNLDYRADLWALAVVAFEMLTGTVPFAGDNPAALAIALGKGTVPPLTALAPNLPRAVDDWFRKACQRDPGKRFTSARELTAALTAALDGAVDGPIGASRTQIVTREAHASGPFDITQADTQVGSLMSVTATMPDMPATVPERTVELLDSVAATTSERIPTTFVTVKKSRALLVAIPVLSIVVAAGLVFEVGRWRAKHAAVVAPTAAEVATPAPVPEIDAAAPALTEPESPSPPPASVAPRASAAAPRATHAKPNTVKRPAPAATYEDLQ